MINKRHRTRSGFILIEAIASVVIMSVALTLIAQALLTNFRANRRFQYAVKDLFIMKNGISRSWLLVASPADNRLSVHEQNINTHLIKSTLTLSPQNTQQPESVINALIYRDAKVTTRSSYGNF